MCYNYTCVEFATSRKVEDAKLKSKQGDQGRGPRNMSGGRGASPVLRVRVPVEMMLRAKAMADSAGIGVADWVRGLIERARK